VEFTYYERLITCSRYKIYLLKIQEVGVHFGSKGAWERDENCVTTIEEASQLAGETGMQRVRLNLINYLVGFIPCQICL